MVLTIIFIDNNNNNNNFDFCTVFPLGLHALLVLFMGS